MKTIRYRRGELKVVGFRFLFINYGKNVRNKYRLEITFTNEYSFPLYYGVKRPMFRNIYVLAFLLLPFKIASYLIMIAGFILHMYFDGARNFIRDKAWQNNVREFNWMNIFIIIILVIILIFK